MFLCGTVIPFHKSHILTKPAGIRGREWMCGCGWKLPVKDKHGDRFLVLQKANGPCGTKELTGSCRGVADIKGGFHVRLHNFDRPAMQAAPAAIRDRPSDSSGIPGNDQSKHAGSCKRMRIGKHGRVLATHAHTQRIKYFTC